MSGGLGTKGTEQSPSLAYLASRCHHGVCSGYPGAGSPGHDNGGGCCLYSGWQWSPLICWPIHFGWSETDVQPSGLGLSLLLCFVPGSFEERALLCKLDRVQAEWAIFIFHSSLYASIFF